MADVYYCRLTPEDDRERSNKGIMGITTRVSSCARVGGRWRSACDSAIWCMVIWCITFRSTVEPYGRLRSRAQIGGQLTSPLLQNPILSATQQFNITPRWSRSPSTTSSHTDFILSVQLHHTHFHLVPPHYIHLCLNQVESIPIVSV